MEMQKESKVPCKGAIPSRVQSCLLFLVFSSGVLVLVYLCNSPRPVVPTYNEIKRNLTRPSHSYHFHELFPRNTSKQTKSAVHRVLSKPESFQTSNLMTEKSKSIPAPSLLPLENLSPSSPSACFSPPLKPFDLEIGDLIKTYPTLNCSAGIPSIARVLKDELIIDPDKAHAAGIDPSSILCRYRSHDMTPGQDFDTTLSDWSVRFTSKIKLAAKDEHLIVECYKTGSESLVAKSYLSIVRESMVYDEVLKRLHSHHSSKSLSKETLSVLMVGIDGMSRSQMIRSMPRTRTYLEQYPGVFEFTKHNKVGMNTFPNIISFVTGLKIEEHTSWNTNKTMDIIPFIWEDFERAGYRTQLILDKKWVTPFHTSKLGWARRPVLFYNRPTVVRSDPDRKIRSVDENCIGDTPEVTLYLDYQEQLIRLCNNGGESSNAYGQTLPFFSYSYFVRLTHDEGNKASSGDDLFLQFFQKLVRQQMLNNTIVLFFSDHGPRFGPIRRTITGMLESINPFCYIWLPVWLLQKYPHVHSALSVNQNRMTSNFDLHQTLKDILNFQGEGQKPYHKRGTDSSSSSSSSRGISLFQEIPRNRTCEKAGVAAVWCSCNQLTRISSTHQRTLTVAQQFVSILNNFTKTNRTLCAKLTLKKVHFAFRVYLDNRLISGEDSREAKLYKVAVITTPGDGMYEGLVRYSHRTESSSVIGIIDRLNIFQTQSMCMPYLEAKPFCFCRDLLTPEKQ